MAANPVPVVETRSAETVRHLHRSIVGDMQRTARSELAHVEQDLKGISQLDPMDLTRKVSRAQKLKH